MINRVTLLGNLGADPELKTLDSDKVVCSLRVATNKTWIKDGEKKERTEWHRVSVFGPQAEPCSKYLKKGRQVYVEGELVYGKYEKEGVTHYTTDIVANLVKFLGESKNSSDDVEDSKSPDKSSKSSKKGGK